MKKICLILGLVLSLGFLPVLADDLQAVDLNTQVTYSPKANVWNNGSMLSDKIVLTRKVVSGTGNYSQYFYNNGKEAFTLGSNYEFLYEGKLIAVHNAELKFYEVVYKDKKFSEKPLCESEIQKIFSDAAIIKISQFKDGKVTVKKHIFDEAEYLLLNDTNAYFHKYSWIPEDVKEGSVAGLIETSKAGKITFSHYNDSSKEFPQYTIIVKNTFKK